MKNKSNNELQKLEDAARAAWLYYVAKNTQDEIAQKLDVSRQSAQRLIALAVSEGLVQVRLTHPISRCMDLAAKLKARFGLIECEVAPSDPTEVNASYGLAQLGAQILERSLKSKTAKVFALGTGRSIKACIDELPNMNCPQHKLVSLVGNMMKDGSASKFDTVVSMASRVNAKHYPLPLPLYAESQQQKQLLLELPAVKNIFNLAQQADITFVGIGQMNQSSPLLVDGFISDSDLASLQNWQCTGEIISWPFSNEGKALHNEFTDKILSVPLQHKPERLVYGIAAGEQKLAAIEGALKGQLINALITNEYTAEQLLKQTDQ